MGPLKNTAEGGQGGGKKTKKTRVLLAAVEGCMLAAFMCDVFDVRLVEETAEWRRGKGALDVLKDLFCLLAAAF